MLPESVPLVHVLVQATHWLPYEMLDAWYAVTGVPLAIVWPFQVQEAAGGGVVGGGVVFCSPLSLAIWSCRSLICWRRVWMRVSSALFDVSVPAV